MDNKTERQPAQVLEQFDALHSSSHKVAVATQVMSKLTPSQQSSVLQQAGVEQPDQSTANLLWRVVIWTMAGVLGVTALSIVYAVVVKHETATDLQIVLTIFTSAVTFVTGVFVPSPAQKK